MLQVPLQASTLPIVDIGPNTSMILSAGLLDFNLDVPITDSQTIGISAFGAGLLYSAALRSTYRLGKLENGLTYGWTIGAGLGLGIGVGGGGFFGPWIQPALAVTLPLLGAESPAKLRASMGPLLMPSLYSASSPFPWQSLIWPNLELAFKVTPSNELTLGGNAIIGWRGFW
jgi:hypothetical protein